MRIRKKDILQVFVILFVFIIGTLFLITGSLLAVKAQYDFASKNSNKTAPAPTEKIYPDLIPLSKGSNKTAPAPASGARNSPDLYKSKSSNKTAPTERLRPDLTSNGSSQKVKKHKK